MSDPLTWIFFSTSRVNWQDPFQPWRVWAHYWYGGFIQNSDWGHMMIENIPTPWKTLMTMEIGDFTISCFFFVGGGGVNFHLFFFWMVLGPDGSLEQLRRRRLDVWKPREGTSGYPSRCRLLQGDLLLQCHVQVHLPDAPKWDIHGTKGIYHP